MKKMISLLLILFAGVLVQCRKVENYGLHCAECIAYRKITSYDPLTNEEFVDLEKVHDKSWCDAQPIVIENFFNSYNNSFVQLMENSNTSTEYCITCETTTYIGSYQYFSSCD
jgi:hypothetical protein